MTRWLAIYSNAMGNSQAAMITSVNAGLPFGILPEELGLQDYESAATVTLIEMPDGDFRPTVVDVDADAEVAMTFIDL
ncbi:hypothetical protein D1610_11540 [Sphingomonas gilva]|uniref:Uncharacterized protein n=1 Tax=Sphingomonas gilva TaxID=2305907 RepID=A0A396S1C2_9SPHN|nr:hypothetical protein [Sphingomonas gilva]RHW17175.1 hypothetical protein D1610_11540 [Sphingomonas gilva]